MPNPDSPKPFLAFDLGAESGRAILAHLRDGSQLAEVPDNSRQHILAGMKIWSEVDRLEPPVEEVSARGAFSCIATVHVQQKAIVSADMHPIVGRNGIQRDGPTKVEHALSFRRSCGAGDPERRPLRRDEAGIKGTRRLLCET